MENKIKSLIIFASCMFFISMPFLFMPPVLNAAYNPLEIINIKPAGTGNPAISPNHRIYRAYPGIEYNIRAAVIGGMYPYKFSLSNAPYGMTINENTGVISWPNPQTSAQSIRLTVTDAENHVATSTWSINVTQNGFIFIDASRTGTETGTISQPYNSIQDILGLSGTSLTLCISGREPILYRFSGQNYSGNWMQSGLLLQSKPSYLACVSWGNRND
ncbi:MAG: Ig domain-containing protein [Desulfomonilia bacterium]